VLFCFVNPILKNRYGPGVIPFEGTWGGRILWDLVFGLLALFFSLCFSAISPFLAGKCIFGKKEKKSFLF